jgi:hypothetical protein
MPAASGRRYEVRDEVVPGLVIRVSPTGGKVWYVSTRAARRVRRIKVGTYPVLTVADARERAREVLRQLQLGTFDRKPETVFTLGDVVPQFIELYAKPRNRSWRSTQRVLAKFSALYAKPVCAIKRGDVVAVLDELMTSGMSTGANRGASGHQEAVRLVS